MPQRENLIIGLDFDGTLVEHAYPHIGHDIGAFEWLPTIADAGGLFILHTMRSDDHLDQAVQYINKRGVDLYGVNRNPTQKEWTNSPKAYCHVYVDDAALGCPLVERPKRRAYVDWNRVGPWLIDMCEMRG